MRRPKGVDVGAVLSTGRQLDLQEYLPVQAFGSYEFPGPAEATLTIGRVDRGLAIGGTIDVTATGRCDRCLDEVRIPLTIEVDERFEPKNDEGGPFAESNVLHGDILDIEDLARQIIDSTLPMALLCSDDCIGLCPTCGEKVASCRCPAYVELEN